jgi:hypothetical protein
MSFNNKFFRAHRFIYYCYYNELSEQIDHKNRIKNDNRIINLRKATSVENGQNKNIRKDNTTGYQGVSFSKRDKKFICYISIDKKLKNLGLFETAEEAYKVRLQAELKHYTFKQY